MLKKSLIIFFLFAFNNGIAQLPFSDPTKEKNQSEQNGITRIIDSLGYAYFDITDQLITEELDNNFESSKLQLLLFEMYKVSENIFESVSGNKIAPKSFTISTTFNELRESTLLKLKRSSQRSLENKDILLYLDFNNFIQNINYARGFYLEIIDYRRTLGRPYISRISSINTELNSVKNFEENRGADGLTDKQWLKIMAGGGGAGAADLLRSTNRINQKAWIKEKKRNRATIEVGEIENIESFSNILNGDVYLYNDFAPEQLSFLYTPDNEIVEGLTRWILYVNSGNHIKISQIFRVGANWTFKDAEGELYREIVEESENKIRLEFSSEFLNDEGFSNFMIENVKLEKNEITFFSRIIEKNKIIKELTPIFTITNIKGNLLDKIKMNINQMRNGVNSYNESLMNLNRY
ncbi:hypothetical protein [Salegentibacter sp. Hel_I_6]|mgnify:CR=1 FL=1|uniref:hypothetical protein n=1 Tax=Salegentibacter sp. Hel_I_6 TaxID=1250278 RepID=UPI000563028F|nr:hypothetical protein [Salegentibacter sp. Hel_I_6]|tara:strand:- start:783 stop:2006 length:1224 start_codon:yes stop_codon:yes gene_type:complete